MTNVEMLIERVREDALAIDTDRLAGFETAGRSAALGRLVEANLDTILAALSSLSVPQDQGASEAAIRADERERCARVAEERAALRERLFNENGASINAAKAVEAEVIAAAIRALPQLGEGERG
jgi:hypothetical protein